MKSEDIFEALYCALSSGDYPELYKVFKQSEQADTDYDDFIKMTGIKPGSDKERMLCDIISELESNALRHGFQQGLKLGLRLMAAAMAAQSIDVSG